MSSDSVLHVEGISKSYAGHRVLHDVSLRVAPGELVGLAGHNGAGKSTLFNVITGFTAPDVGTVTFSADDGTTRRLGAAARARRAGVSIVRQELAQCPALTVAETAVILSRKGGGLGWRKASWRRLRATLDEMFPGHPLRASDSVAELGIAARQMLECAGAVLRAGDQLTLLILDEPTSSLDRDAAGSLYRWLRGRAADGLAAIVTTHRLQEMIENLDRVVVLRDGKLIGEEWTDDRDAREVADAVVRQMGTNETTDQPKRPSSGDREAGGRGQSDQTGEVCLRITNEDGSVYEARRGEIVGLGGLEGHGQREVLRAALDAVRQGTASTRTQRVASTADSAYVTGDRTNAGIFRFWSVTKNLSIASLATHARLGFISRATEAGLTSSWFDRLGITVRPGDGMTSLSGGTQQKVLIARALATGSPVLLLEDPFRGVDQATKEEAYRIIHQLSADGKCVIWYSTEIEEYQQCDRLLVFREGRIVREIDAATVEDRQAIVAASFAEPEQVGS